MSNLLIDDESSRLKQFIWEEVDENFFLAVIFRSNRRYVVQRHFEQQLFDIKSSIIQNKWRRCLLEVISKSLSAIYLTRHEVELMHEIFSWHMNCPNNSIKLREQIDYMIDFEDLIDCFQSISFNDTDHNDTKSFLIQPVTTLDAARKNIERWKNLQQENFMEKSINPTVDSRSSLLSTKSSSGWLQLDSKVVPFIKKHCDHLLPVEYLLKEHVISSSEDFSLRSLYIPISSEDFPIWKILIQSNFILTNRSLFITLDHLIFRLKRLFFIRFLSSSTNLEQIDYQKVMSFNGGLVTLFHTRKEQIPFIYINQQKYIPQMNISGISTFYMANKYELEYLRLISLYEYLSSDDNNEKFIYLSSVNNLTLIPIDFYYEEKFFTIISLHDFHYHEYQRRTQQEKSLIDYDDNPQASTGWWQPPVSSSKRKRPLSNFKLQRPIFF